MIQSPDLLSFTIEYAIRALALGFTVKFYIA